MNRNLFSLQGYVRIGKRKTNGRPGQTFWAGNVPEATLELTAESSDKKESFSGNRGKYHRMYTERGGTFSGTFDEWSLRVLGLMLHSQQMSTASGSVSNEAFPTSLVVGDEIALDHPYASSLVLTDSTGSPVTVDTDDYELIGHNDRIVRIKGLASYTQPFKAAYTYAAYNTLDFFSQNPEEVYVVFDGIDTEYNQPVLIDLFRTQFNPVTGLGLINEELGSLPFSAELLFDPLNVDENGKGGYARFLSKEPA